VLLKRNFITLELRHVEINISSSARIVQLAKNQSDYSTHFLTHATAFSGSHFSYVTQKLGNSKMSYNKTSYYKTKNPVKLKFLYRVYKGRQFILNFGIWLRHMKYSGAKAPPVRRSEKGYGGET